jgi:hypothetical protein
VNSRGPRKQLSIARSCRQIDRSMKTSSLTICVDKKQISKQNTIFKEIYGLLLPEGSILMSPALCIFVNIQSF